MHALPRSQRSNGQKQFMLFGLHIVILNFNFMGRTGPLDRVLVQICVTLSPASLAICFVSIIIASIIASKKNERSIISFVRILQHHTGMLCHLWCRTIGVGWVCGRIQKWY
jgi:hypothetical protein